MTVLGRIYKLYAIQSVSHTQKVGVMIQPTREDVQEHLRERFAEAKKFIEMMSSANEDFNDNLGEPFLAAIEGADLLAQNQIMAQIAQKLIETGIAYHQLCTITGLMACGVVDPEELVAEEAE